MEAWLSGAFSLDDEDTRSWGRALSVHLTASRPRLGRRHLAFPVRGELCAERLAERSVVQGTVELRFGTAQYGLCFDDDAGSACELRGTQELWMRRPPRGPSVVSGELLRDGRAIGRVRLRLDPRSGMKGLFRWA